MHHALTAPWNRAHAGPVRRQTGVGTWFCAIKQIIPRSQSAQAARQVKNERVAGLAYGGEDGIMMRLFTFPGFRMIFPP